MKFFVIILLSTFYISAFSQKSNSDIISGNKSYNSEKYTNAEVDYRRALSRDSTLFIGNYNLGNALYKQGKMSDAFDSYKKALDYSKKAKALPPQLAATLHNMGNVLLTNKQYEQSIEAYKQALKLNPSDNETRYNLAYAQQFLKKQQQQKNQNNNDDEDSILKRAKELVAQRKYQEAYDLMKNSEKKYPKLKQYADFTERIFNVIKINQ